MGWLCAAAALFGAFLWWLEHRCIVCDRVWGDHTKCHEIWDGKGDRR